MHSNDVNGTNGSATATKEGLLSKLPAHNVTPLWTIMKSMVPPIPQPQAEVAIWRYKDMRPLLIEACDLVTAEEAERRVLMLINPALSRWLSCRSQ